MLSLSKVHLIDEVVSKVQAVHNEVLQNVGLICQLSLHCQSTVLDSFLYFVAFLIDLCQVEESLSKRCLNVVQFEASHNHRDYLGILISFFISLQQKQI